MSISLAIAEAAPAAAIQRGGLGGCLYLYWLKTPVSATGHIEGLQQIKEKQ